jgi:hypothetical protein
MLTGIHFLLTYTCLYECDHCFLYCSPSAKGTFTLKQVRQVLEEARRIETIEWIYFEGGEPLLFYPLLLESLKTAREMGFKTGVVTNAYMATSEEDAELWLKPFSERNLSFLSISDDEFHSDEEDRPAQRALAAAKRLNLPADSICINKPTLETGKEGEIDKSSPVIGGGALLKGRAAEKLADDLPRRSWQTFKECPHEELKDPERVHVDAYGHVHLCQGLSIGNMWETPLSELIKDYRADRHPICGPLVRGGPALLAEEYGVKHEDRYVDECHFCFLTRSALIDRFPMYLTPKQVYGLE